MKKNVRNELLNLMKVFAILLVFNSHCDPLYPVSYLATGGALGNSLFFIISGYLLPFMTCLRELTLFMLLCRQDLIITTMMDYFDEMGLYAFSSGINLILIVVILVCNALVNKLTGASLDSGIGGGK